MTNPPQPAKKQTNTIGVVLMIVTVLCCGGVAINAFKGSSHNDTPAAAAPTATSVEAPSVSPAPIVDLQSLQATPTPTPARTASSPKPRPTTGQPSTRPATKRTTTKRTTTAATHTGAVHPGAFCSPEGATGHTVKGTLMRCTFKSGDTRARWRAA